MLQEFTHHDEEYLYTEIKIIKHTYKIAELGIEAAVKEIKPGIIGRDERILAETLSKQQALENIFFIPVYTVLV